MVGLTSPFQKARSRRAGPPADDAPSTSNEKAEKSFLFLGLGIYFTLKFELPSKVSLRDGKPPPLLVAGTAQ